MTTEASTHPQRRSLVRWLLGGGFTISLISFLYPVIRFLNPPAVSEASVNEVVDGKVQDLAPNAGKIVRFGNSPVLLIRLSANRVARLLGGLHPSELHRAIRRVAQADLVRLSQWPVRSERQSDFGSAARPLKEYAVHLRGEDVVISRSKAIATMHARPATRSQESNHGMVSGPAGAGIPSASSSRIKPCRSTRAPSGTPLAVSRCSCL